MPLAMTVNLGWPWWVITTIASGVVVAGLLALAVSRISAARAIAGLLAVEGVVIAVVAPFVMSDMDSNGSALAAGSTAMSSRSSNASIHVIEHAPPSHMRMVGGVQIFANPVFDSRDAKRIGRDQGFCVHIVLARGWECVWTTFLPGGLITVEGAEDVNQNLSSGGAITGGTGKYRNARGWLEVKTHNKAGTEFDEFFHVN